jgi:hypothetical protein
MTGDNDCPKCDQNIGMWAVLRAPLPNRIYCPHCGTRLEYGGTWGLIVAASVLTIVLVLAAALVVNNIDDRVTSWVAAGGVFLVGGMLLEVGLVMQLWYGGYRLQQVGKPRPSDERDSDW